MLPLRTNKSGGYVLTTAVEFSAAQLAAIEKRLKRKPLRHDLIRIAQRAVEAGLLDLLNDELSPARPAIRDSGSELHTSGDEFNSQTGSLTAEVAGSWARAGEGVCAWR